MRRQKQRHRKFNPREFLPAAETASRRALRVAFKISVTCALAVFGVVALWGAVSHGRPSDQWSYAQMVEKFGEAEARARKQFFAAGTLPTEDLKKERRVSCCGEADAYEADDFDTDVDGNVVAILTCNDPRNCDFGTEATYDDNGDTVTAFTGSGKPEIAAGTRFKVMPHQILVPNAPPNLTGHGWIFIGAGKKVLCYGFPSGF